MEELRLRLIAALHDADCGCEDTPTHFGAQYTPQGDAALAVFAEWLRGEASSAAKLGGIWVSVVAELLREFADDMDMITATRKD